MASINNSLFPFLFTSTESSIGATGATSLSESVKLNTALTELRLSCENKRKTTYKWHPLAIHSFPFLFTPTDNIIGDTGVTSLSDSLKSNTTLTELNLGCEDKRKDTQMTSINNSLFSISHHINRQQHWIHRSNIIKWFTEIKHNTQETQSEKWRQKKENTQMTFINNSLFFLFSLHQQVTRLEKQEQHHWVNHWNQTQHSLNSIWVVNTKGNTQMASINNSLLYSLFISIGNIKLFYTTTPNRIGDAGATSLSEALKSNTTLTKLNLNS